MRAGVRFNSAWASDPWRHSHSGCRFILLRARHRARTQVKQKGAWVDYRDQHVIITGGSSGIGRAMAQLFVQRGAHVSIMARRQELLEETLQELAEIRTDASQRLEARSVDVSDFQQVEQAIASLMSNDYAVDILVNAAGIVHCGVFENVSLPDFYRTVSVDLYGTVHAVRAVLPAMIEQQRGHIVVFSSVLGYAASFGYTAYCAAKFGVRGFSDALRHELKPHGIYVSCVFPQDTDTPQLHQERQMQPLEARRISQGANAVLDVHQVARSIVRGIERHQTYILPGLQTKLFFPLFGGSHLLAGFLRWFFIDRVVAQVRRERDAGLGHIE
jgi:3-dehydrosphinganine reductase